MRAYVTNGPRNGLHIDRKVGPCPGSRRRWVLGSVDGFSQAAHAANTHRPRFQVRARSWLQDTLKRKLVDFAWIRRLFLFTRRVLAFFRVNPAESFNQPDFFIRSACFDPSSGQPRVNPGKQEGGGDAKKFKKSASFLFEVSCSQRRPS